MFDTVDAVIILTANWDTYLEPARPFLTAGILTFVGPPSG